MIILMHTALKTLQVTSWSMSVCCFVLLLTVYIASGKSLYCDYQFPHLLNGLKEICFTGSCED